MFSFFPAGMTTVLFIFSNIQPNTLAIRAPCMSVITATAQMNV